MDMKSISQKLQDDIRAIMEAGLHPNQQKIDVHEPEKDKITADDFKKLRAMKKDSNGKITKEDTEVVNELSKKTLGSYIKKNVGDQRDLSYNHGADPDEYESDPESVRKADNRETGLKKAVKRLTKEDSVQEEEKKKPVSPFDYKNYTSQIPKKPGELTGHDSKKISTGTVYTKKPVKEEVEQGMVEADELRARGGLAAINKKPRPGQTDLRNIPAGNYPNSKNKFTDKDREEQPANLKAKIKATLGKHTRPNLPKGGVKEEVDQNEYTFADYLEAARAQYVDEDAVLIANEAFKNQDITLFSDHSQSPEA